MSNFQNKTFLIKCKIEKKNNDKLQKWCHEYFKHFVKGCLKKYFNIFLIRNYI